MYTCMRPTREVIQGKVKPAQTTFHTHTITHPSQKQEGILEWFYNTNQLQLASFNCVQMPGCFIATTKLRPLTLLWQGESREQSPKVRGTLGGEGVWWKGEWGWVGGGDGSGCSWTPPHNLTQQVRLPPPKTIMRAPHTLWLPQPWSCLATALATMCIHAKLDTV